MELLVWPGDHGLPSMDITSIQMMAYCKFTGAPVKVNHFNRTWNIFNHIPLFAHGVDVKLSSFNDLVSHLQRQNYNCGQNSQKLSSIDVDAYMTTISSKLEPALLYLYWAHEGNYLNLTRPWYASKLPFPASWILPDRYQNGQLDKLSVRIGDKEKWPEKEKQLITEAEKCLQLLSHKLGDQKYFFGDFPTVFDAYVYGYLAVCTLPFPLNPLKNSMSSLPNLESYLSRILRTYFPDILRETPGKKLSEDNDFPNKKLDIALSTLFAGTVMFTWVYLHLRHFKKL